MRLHVERFGRGPAALFIHGLGWGLEAFGEQRQLADAYRVLIVDRTGFGGSPRGSADAVGWPVDAPAVIDVLASIGSAHIVGHSIGAVIGLLVAGMRPELVRSLVAIEPPLFDAALDDARVRAIGAAQRSLYDSAASMSAREWWIGMCVANGLTVDQATNSLAGLTEDDSRTIENGRRERYPGDAPIEFEPIRAASWPKALVVGTAEAPSGLATVRAAMLKVAEVVAERTDATLVRFAGSTHAPQLEEPERFNAFLRELWSGTATRPSASHD